MQHAVVASYRRIPASNTGWYGANSSFREAAALRLHQVLALERYEALIRVSQGLALNGTQRSSSSHGESHRVVQFDGLVVAQYDEASNEIV